MWRSSRRAIRTVPMGTATRVGGMVAVVVTSAAGVATGTAVPWVAAVT